MRGDLRNDGGANALEAGAEGHGESGSAITVRENLDVRGAREAADLRDRCGIIFGRDVVGRELCGGGRQVNAGAEIEQPDIESRGEEIFEQIRFDCIDRKDGAGNAEPVKQHDGAFLSTLIASETQLNAVGGIEEVDFGGTDAKRALFAWRSIGLKNRGLCENASIHIEEDTAEETAEASLGFETFNLIRRVGRSNGGELMHEIFREDVQDSLPGDG